ncbi:MAG: class B sortase [Ruminococcaceae bacterium]|nr:class B sortase [Oscillospiraceae bacterium]
MLVIYEVCMNKKQKALFIILAAIFLVTAIALVINFVPMKEDYDAYKIQPTNQSKNSSIASNEESLLQNPIDFKALKESNNEVVGWIQIPNTVIDYPILQSGADTDEDFYLSRNLEKEKSTKGSIYIQKINSMDFTDENTLIYGHNMRNGSMFGSLKKFRNADFFNENDTIYIYTDKQILKYKIYSAFVYNDRHILNEFDFSKAEDYQKFIDITLNPDTNVKNIRKDVKVTTDDRIIALSTCTNVDTERYLVVAVLINDTYTN